VHTSCQCLDSPPLLVVVASLNLGLLKAQSETDLCVWTPAHSFAVGATKVTLTTQFLFTTEHLDYTGAVGVK